MTDRELLALYEARSEEAIAATRERYGAYCRAIALRVLENQEDVEECLSDVWLRAWNAIPPERPEHFKGWLGTVARNSAITLCRKRDHLPRQVEESALELAQALTGGPGEAMEAKELGEAVSRFLRDQPPQHRAAFLHRYWYGDTVEETAARLGWTVGKTKTVLFRTRGKLRDYLKKEELYDG